MDIQKIYKCSITGYFIEFILKNECAYVNTIMTDYFNLKAFFVLLRNAIDSLIKLNIKTIRQTVSHEEWELYLSGKTSWRIIPYKTTMDIHEIECDINDFLQNYGVGIGILD